MSPSLLPFHPFTNLQALGLTKRGLPIWPVMGAAEDPVVPPSVPDAPDRGFPESTPVKDMTVEQQAAYYQHQNRQTDNKLKAFNGFTPQDVNAMWSRLEELEGERLTADQKAIKSAADQAADAARAEARAEFQPKLDQAMLRSVASSFLNGDQLESFVTATNPAAFYGESGEVDRDKVIGHLTALFGQQQKPGGQQQPPPVWGQHSGGQPPVRPGAAGNAAADKRFGTPT